MDDFEQEYYWLDRPDDYNVWEENQLALDRDAGEFDEYVDFEDGLPIEDDMYDAGIPVF